MEARVERLEARIEELAHALGAIERRLAALERSVANPVSAPAPALPHTAAVDRDLPLGVAHEAPPALGRDVALVGRVLLALGGGFLLRAVTDAALVPGAIGLGAGLAYALVWLALADRAARLGAHRSAIAHAATAACLGFPLAWEAAVRFRILPTLGGVLLAGALAAGLLLISGRRALPSLGVMAVAAAALCALAITFGAREPGAAALLLALLTPTVAVLSRRADRVVAPWLALGALTLAYGIAGLGALVERATLSPGRAVALQALLLATVLVASEVLVRRGSTGRWALLQWVQAAIALTLGWGGALLVGHARLPQALPWLGASSLAIAGVLLLRHLAPVDLLGRLAALPDAHAWRLSASFAVALLAGGVSASAPSHTTTLWSTAAVALAALAAATGSRTAFLQAALLVALAAGAGGLAISSARALVGSAPPAAAWPLASLAPLIAALLCLATPRTPADPARARWPGWSEDTGRALLLALALLGAGAVALDLATAGLSLDPGVRAAARTGALVLLAVGAAAASRLDRLRAAAWLVYPLFAATAIKMVVEDVPHGRPSTLFASLALFGLALLTAPRLARRPPGNGSDPSAAG
ncbi:MAG TPA: hypothetical protein VMV46_18045 [Thermoanaerobaculia bacterium]|nr:hypothetical protein [Thermoanaerobaculia bacterium]